MLSRDQRVSISMPPTMSASAMMKHSPNGARSDKLDAVADPEPLPNPDAVAVLRLGLGSAFEHTLTATFAGDLAIYLAILEECHSSCADALAQLEDAAAAGDLKAVANAAHFIRGSALTVGATELARAATRLE